MVVADDKDIRKIIVWKLMAIFKFKIIQKNNEVCKLLSFGC
jgi:hypothetical protein